MPLPPLAERFRPARLDDLIGQEHLIGKGSILRKAIESNNVPSMILWGPPGVGKTTIANIIANTLDVPFYTLTHIAAKAPLNVKFPKFLSPLLHSYNILP